LQLLADKSLFEDKCFWTIPSPPPHVKTTQNKVNSTFKIGQHPMKANCVFYYLFIFCIDGEGMFKSIF